MKPLRPHFVLGLVHLVHECFKMKYGTQKLLWLRNLNWGTDDHVKYFCSPSLIYLGVSINGVPPNHPLLVGFSLINHLFGVYPHLWKPPNI